MFKMEMENPFDEDPNFIGGVCGKENLSAFYECDCYPNRVRGCWVLCEDCFQKDDHKDHKYRLRSAGSNAFCDCGDTDVWSQLSCSKHYKQN